MKGLYRPGTMRKSRVGELAGLAVVCWLVSLGLGQAGSPPYSEIGVFENQTDVGAVKRPGAAAFDPAREQYEVAGGGENMWGSMDAFHFVWRRMSGDFVLTADLAILGTGGNPHRKAGWVVRQGLEPDAPYADAVVHGVGLTSLQFRETAGGPTKEVQAAATSPTTIRLERRGNVFTMSVARSGEALQAAGSTTLALRDPVYVGLAVCAHDNNALERAVFSRVSIRTRPSGPSQEPAVESRLETVSIETGERRVVYRAPRLFEAPNWSRDGRFFAFNGGGRIYTVPVEGGEATVLDTGSANRCNNDHGISPDGKMLAISHQPKGPSLISIVPIGGGEPRLVTPRGPSYWHGWSPDGKTLAYCAERNGNFDVYTIPVEGGDETRLTDAPGLDDGPEYSPDGKYIYFNSDRTGLMQIWRMKADGRDPEQVTGDGYADWFPHPSPDGKWLVFLSYDKSVTGHPANKDVTLRLMPLAGGRPRILAKLLGGQGTINVPSWSPDSRSVAFVSYRLIPR